MPDFTPPLILHATSRSRLMRVRDGVVTALLWAGWLYLLIAAIGTLWLPPFVHHLLPVDPPSNPWGVLESAALCAAIAGGVCAVVRWRVSRHRRRFAGEDRRKALPQPDAADLAAEFGVPADDLVVWRRSRRLLVHQDRDGRVVAVETGPEGHGLDGSFIRKVTHEIPDSSAVSAHPARIVTST